MDVLEYYRLVNEKMFQSLVDKLKFTETQNGYQGFKTVEEAMIILKEVYELDMDEYVAGEALCNVLCGPISKATIGLLHMKMMQFGGNDQGWSYLRKINKKLLL